MTYSPTLQARRLWVFSALVVACFWLFIPTEAEAGAGNRSAQENEARRVCLKGDFSRGVDILIDLFVETKNPVYIFNQGRCYEQNQQFEKAVSRFEEYLRATENKISAEDKASAEKHIADCRANIARETSTQPPPVAPAPLKVEPSPPPAQTEGQPVDNVAVQGTGTTGRKWGLITAGIVTGAVGLGSIGVGLAYYAEANNLRNEMQSVPGAYTPSKESKQNDYRTYSVVGYGVGAACVLTGAILLGYGLVSQDNASATTALMPTVGAGHVGAAYMGVF